jgi:hypothetical protein
LKNINILQLQAKDVVFNDYKVKSLKRYSAVFDYSLESIKMEEIHHKVFRNNKFIFQENGKNYTNDIISIAFDYRHKNYSIFELRNKLYKDGFYCEGKHYVRYKRSSGSARVGKCLFIREELYYPMMKWSNMGLSFKKDSEVDLASMEAYIALTTSSIIGTIQIYPENILLIDDYESIFEDEAVVVEVENNKLRANNKKTIIKNSIWDGQSLLDESLFNGEYKDKGMLLLRNRFFKSCCFNTKIQKFFKDHKITSINQLKGKTIAKDISQIKLITTPSSIKFLKFGTYDNFLERMDSLFGVVKYDKKTHFMEGELVQTHYQLLNTLEFTREDMEKFLEDSFDYLKKLKRDLSVFRYQLKIKNNILNRFQLQSMNDFIYQMLILNDDIKKTSMFYNFKKEFIRAYIANMRKGHILVNGNYSTMMGNGYEMLLESIGKFLGGSVIEKEHVMTVRFLSEKELLGIRSPHITMGNIWVVKNRIYSEYLKYFNLSEQIICVNAIESNLQNRLNGCDYDSDSILVTDNKILVEKAKMNYDKFLVPVPNIPSTKIKRYNNYNHKNDLDDKTSVNKIGEIVNYSQVLNSFLWELKKEGKDYSSVYNDICILAVMSGIEIDKAKKEYSINNEMALKELKTKYKYIIDKKPMFFSYLPNKFILFDQEILSKCYRNYETSMDYLENSINKNQKKIRAPKEEKITIGELVNNNDYIIERKDKIKARRVIKECEILKNKSDLVWSNPTLSSQEKYFTTLELQDDFIKKIKNKKLTKEVICFILKNLSTKIQRKMLFTLYQTNPQQVEDLLMDKKKKIEIIKRDDDGDIILYQKKFKKIQKQ